MDNKELAELLKEASLEIIRWGEPDRGMQGIDLWERLRAAAATLEKSDEGVEELQTKLAAVEANAARYRWLLDNAVCRWRLGEGLALVVPYDMPLSAVDAAIDAARGKV